MINYLIAVLDKHSTSFCYYQNPSYYQTGSSTSGLIPLKELEKVVDYVIRNKISVNFLYGNQNLPAAYEELVESVTHVKIMPLKLYDQKKEGIYVINRDDREHTSEIEENSRLNLILRLEREDLPELASIFYSLSGKYRRLNLCLLNIEEYSEADLKEYEKQLKKIENYAAQEYRAGNMIEINIVSDRLMLQNMNNCDAGITHLTAAPNGELYLCPGLYYDNEENSIGTLNGEIEIRNNHLLQLNYAPICRNCDAYHCKRCVWLNKKITLEYNTPSHQQCVISHLERNTSMRLFETLKPSVEMFKKFVSIPKIPYLDPYEIINNITNQDIDPEEGEKLIAELLSKPLEKLSSVELLHQIYKLDKNMLIKLKNINQGE